MNKITDIIISTQLCTCVAAVLAIVAHFIDNGTILNPNWHWAVYFCLVVAVFFMLLPHLISHGPLTYTDTLSADERKQITALELEHFGCPIKKTGIYHIDRCHNQPVKDPDTGLFI